MTLAFSCAIVAAMGVGQSKMPARLLHERIDQIVETAHLGPVAPLAREAEFLRKVYLDLVGRIPSAAEAQTFLEDESSDKRRDLIDQLLDNPRYARHWANVFDVILMERLGGGHVPAAEWQSYLLESFAQNKPYDQLMREILSADGTEEKLRPAARFYLDRGDEMHRLTRDIGRIVFGRDLQCARCHDHPLVNDYLQSEYYGLFAFFNRSFLFSGKPKDGQKTIFAEKAEGEAHDGWVRSLAISPSGQWLASGGNDQMVRMWNPVDGQLIRELSGHDSHLYCVRFHPDGKFLLSGDLSGWVRQWDASTGSELRRFDATALHSYNGDQRVHFGGVLAMSVSTDRRYLACGGLHKANNPFAFGCEVLVLLFDWDSQQLVRRMVVKEKKQGVVWQLAFHPDGFLVGGTGTTSNLGLVFWKLDQENEFFKLQLPGAVREMDMHPDGLRLATAHSDSHLRISRMAAKKA